MVDYHDLHSIGPCTCPKCRGSNSSKSYSNNSSNYKSTHSGRGKKVAALILVLVVILGAGGYFVIPRLNLFALQQAPTAPTQPANSPSANAGTTTSVNESPNRAPEQPKVTEPIATEQAPPVDTVNTISQQILTKQLTMFSKDMQELSAVTIPAKNKGVLEAKVIPEKQGILEVKFYKNGGAYCTSSSPTSCVFDVKGTDVASQKIDIPVKTGDAVGAVISNKSTSGFSQQVTVVFAVSYDEVISTPKQAVPDQTITPSQVTSTKQTYDITGKPIIDTLTLEKQIHALINNYRTSNGLTALSFDDKLADIARKHSLDMVQNNYFDHVNLQGQDPSARGAAAGYSCYKALDGGYYRDGLGENIMQSWLYRSITYYNGIPSYNWWTQDEIAKDVAQGWWESPGHKANILTASYDRHGLGVAIADNGKVYTTDDFC